MASREELIWGGYKPPNELELERVEEIRKNLKKGSMGKKYRREVGDLDHY